jgi:hypothetical protein
MRRGRRRPASWRLDRWREIRGETADGPPALGANLFRDNLRFATVSAGDDDGRSLRGECSRDGLADTGGTAGHEDSLVCQLKIHADHRGWIQTGLYPAEILTGPYNRVK